MTDQRDKAFELYKQGIKYKEIAEAVGVSESAIKMWASRYWKPKKSQSKSKTEKRKVTTKKTVRKVRNKPGAGAPKGSTNASTHGGYNAVMWGNLSDEEKELIANFDDDEENILVGELKLLTIREWRLMAAIDSFRNSSGGITGMTVTSIEEKTSDFEGNSSLTLSSSNISAIARLEAELNSTQLKKIKAAEALNRIRMSRSSGGDGELADAWVNAVLECDENDKSK